MDDKPNEKDVKPAVTRLTRDLVKAAATMTDTEARYLVDAYYIMQENRKRTRNQESTMNTEPHSVIVWLSEQSEVLEGQLKRALNSYSDNHPVGVWMKSVYGIGPVISAGLLAHIDIDLCPTAGHIWRYAGLDPTVKWNKGEIRPWNTGLKTLCWKIGQSFMKFSNEEACIYGAMYKDRKAYEVKRNDAGNNAERSALILTQKKWKKSTDAYKAYTSGKLPPAHVDAQARRWVVKIFISHVHLVWYWQKFGKVAPKPYSLEHMGHVDYFTPPNLEMFPGLLEALRQAMR